MPKSNSTAEVVAISRQHNQQDLDFFSKEQITIGTRLIYKGRRDPDTFYRVSRIRTVDGRNGKETDVNIVQRVKDTIYVTDNRGRTYAMAFAYLSYSSIWRIVA